MLVGGHVSTAGGLVRAHERGVEMGCEAIQIFNQSPRMWRPTKYDDDQIAEFRRRMADGPIQSVVIHAVYLINCASKDRAIRRKSLNALAHALRLGDAIGADGVVVHPGAQKGEPLEASLKRAGDAFRRVLAESERCPLLLEDTAGAGGTLGRSFEELQRLIELGGGHRRLGVCLDCCHLHASGFEVRTPDALDEALDECDSIVGLKRLRCLHVNDSKTALGSNRDRHENLPDGELGRRGLAVFLSEPRFEGLPALLEVPGPDGHGPDAEQIAIAKKLRANGLRRRKRARGGRAGRTRRTGQGARQARRRSRG